MSRVVARRVLSLSLFRNTFRNAHNPGIGKPCIEIASLMKWLCRKPDAQTKKHRKGHRPSYTPVSYTHLRAHETEADH
eukprot:5729193-Amphidinium_carterae.1